MLEEKFKAVKKKVLENIEEQYIEISGNRYMELENEIVEGRIEGFDEFEARFVEFK